MNRIWAIIERDLRRFRRSPALVIISTIFPGIARHTLFDSFAQKRVRYCCLPQ